MTPKEKAIELVNKYQSCEINFLEYAWVCPKGAKKLALIAVDEIQKIIPYNPATIINLKTNEVQEIMGFDEGSYFEEVKQEIEKL